MGQGAQTTNQGGAPSWTPQAAMQAMAQGQWNPQASVQPFAAPEQNGNILSFLTQQMASQPGITSPLQMDQAQQRFRDARQDFRAIPPGPGRREARPDFLAARNQWRAMQSGPQLPDPMDRARGHFLAARDQFRPVQQEFRGLDGAERAAMRPEMQAARGEFSQMRDWYRNLQGLPEATQIGTAAMGPPIPQPPAQMSPTMAIPNFPGRAPTNSVADLVKQIQQRTATTTYSGGGGGDRGGDGGLGPSSEFPKDERQLTDAQREQLLREAAERRMFERGR